VSSRRSDRPAFLDPSAVHPAIDPRSGFGVDGLPDLRQFFCWTGDSGRTPRKGPRRGIRINIFFTQPQKEFDKIIFLLLSRKEKDEIHFLENS
jgi:hypothetical protein